MSYVGYSRGRHLAETMWCYESRAEAILTSMAILLEHVLLDSALIAATWNSGKQSLAFTHGSGSNVSFFFLSNWSLEIMLHTKKIKYQIC